MKKKTRRKKHQDYYEEDFEGVRVEDLRVVPRNLLPLPSPAEIARSLRHAKITILLDAPTVEFFKQKSAEHHVSYQQMIRQVLRNYTEKMRRAA